MKKRQILLVFVLISVTAAGLFSQSAVSEPNAVLASLTDISGRLIPVVRPYLNPGNSLYVSGLTYQNRPSQLGSLFASVFLARLSEVPLSNVRLYGPGTRVPAAPETPSFSVAGE